MAEEELPRIQGKRRAIPGASDTEECLLGMVTTLTSELAITRERLDTLERLVEKAGILERPDIETFEAAPAQAEERQGIRQRLIAKVFRPLRDAAERDARQAGQAADH
ncbi:MAG: hypothetical protein KJO76_06400 [Gammaproteobacteria bacterium]|nr:hypothetical protein [Gammaproteobacteria bacterium]